MTGSCSEDADQIFSVYNEGRNNAMSNICKKRFELYFKGKLFVQLGR